MDTSVLWSIILHKKSVVALMATLWSEMWRQTSQNDVAVPRTWRHRNNVTNRRTGNQRCVQVKMSQNFKWKRGKCKQIPQGSHPACLAYYFFTKWRSTWSGFGSASGAWQETWVQTVIATVGCLWGSPVETFFWQGYLLIDEQKILLSAQAKLQS